MQSTDNFHPSRRDWATEKKLNAWADLNRHEASRRDAQKDKNTVLLIEKAVREFLEHCAGAALTPALAARPAPEG